MTTDRDNAYAAHQMHIRLVEWGNVQLRGPGLFNPDDGEPDNLRRVEWTGEQRRRAAKLHSIIIRLPEWRLNIVLQVFYKAGQASHWHTLRPEQQRQIERDLTDELNRRSRNRQRDTGIETPAINPRMFAPLRERAIRVLIDMETLLTAKSSTFFWWLK